MKRRFLVYLSRYHCFLPIPMNSILSQFYRQHMAAEIICLISRLGCVDLLCLAFARCPFSTTSNTYKDPCGFHHLSISSWVSYPQLPIQYHLYHLIIIFHLSPFAFFVSTLCTGEATLKHLLSNCIVILVIPFKVSTLL